MGGVFSANSYFLKEIRTAHFKKSWRFFRQKNAHATEIEVTPPLYVPPETEQLFSPSIFCAPSGYGNELR